MFSGEYEYAPREIWTDVGIMKRKKQIHSIVSVIPNPKTIQKSTQRTL